MRASTYILSNAIFGVLSGSKFRSEPANLHISEIWGGVRYVPLDRKASQPNAIVTKYKAYNAYTFPLVLVNEF